MNGRRPRRSVRDLQAAAELLHGIDWRDLDRRQLPGIVETEETFASLEELQARHPDLAERARELLQRAPENATVTTWSVTSWRHGESAIGAFENAIVRIHIAARGRRRASTIGRPVIRRKQLATIDELRAALAAFPAPTHPLEQSGGSAAAAIREARAHVRWVEAVLSRFAEFPPAPDRWQEHVGVLIGAMDQAYRAGRMVREAEIIADLEKLVQEAAADKEGKRRGQAIETERKRGIRDARQREVGKIARGKLRHGWMSRAKLASAVREAWDPNVPDDDRPAASTLDNDLKELKLPGPKPESR